MTLIESQMCVPFMQNRPSRLYNSLHAHREPESLCTAPLTIASCNRRLTTDVVLVMTSVRVTRVSLRPANRWPDHDGCS